MQLHPREQFTITRQLQDPYIVGTFYVRAVIRNAKTDTILDTLDLDDKTNQRFTKAWSVPADVSGQGFWVSIITSVYTDSGYTTKSENYGDEENTYLIQDRFNHNIGGVGGGGADVDYKKIRKIVEEVVGKKFEDFKPETKVVTVTKEVIKDIKFPAPEKIKFPDFPSFTPILDVLKRIEKKEFPAFPEIPEVDFAPVLTAVQKLADLSSKQKEELSTLIKSSLQKNTDRYKKIEEMKKMLNEFPMDDEMAVSPEEKKEDPRIKSLIKIK